MLNTKFEATKALIAIIKIFKNMAIDKKTKVIYIPTDNEFTLNLKVCKEVILRSNMAKMEKDFKITTPLKIILALMEKGFESNPHRVTIHTCFI